MANQFDIHSGIIGLLEFQDRPVHFGICAATAHAVVKIGPIFFDHLFAGAVDSFDEGVPKGAAPSNIHPEGLMRPLGERLPPV